MRKHRKVVMNFWNDSTIPSVISVVDPNSVELGIKFYSDISGTIDGISFYKSVQNVGLHKVSLWTLAGSRLGTATSSNETASGWQHVYFSKPIKISAATQYIASYHSPGYYSANNNYFSSEFRNGPLHGVTGVYKYVSTSSFPSLSYQASNYWVDVIFSGNYVPVALNTPTGLSATATESQITLYWSAA